jgi:hypothetical protein
MIPSIRDSVVSHAPPDKKMAGWFNEAVWGHRLQAQSGWATVLEFMGMAEGMITSGSLLEPTTPTQNVVYCAPVSKELRILLFHNPRMVQIRDDHQGDEVTMWREWLQDINGRTGDDAIDFAYLKKLHPQFELLVAKIELLRKLALDTGKSSKFTNRLLFPIGPAALYEPGDLKFVRDRTIFTRTGEIAYLMLTRASENLREELRCLLQRFLRESTSRNKLIRSLLPSGDLSRGGAKGATFLPYKEHPAFNRFAEDLIKILRLNLPHQDALEHIRFLLPFHIYLYGIETSAAWAGREGWQFFVCEIPGPKMDVVRRASIGNRDENEALGVEGMRCYIQQTLIRDERVVEILDPNFRTDMEEKDRASELATELQRLFFLNEAQTTDLNKLETREDVRAAIHAEAAKAYRSGTLSALESLGREAGLIDSRGTTKKRYAPTDHLIRALVFANLSDDSHVEESDFLAILRIRYGLVFGPREAVATICEHNPQHYDEADFKRNQSRLSRRLVGLGLGNSMSDSCTYVVNPLGISADKAVPA